MKKLFVFGLLALIGLSSCNSKKIYEKHIDNERITWNRFDVKTFEVEIKDVSTAYNFLVAIRHHTEVPFRYVDVRMVIYTPDGETRIMEQQIMLRDKDGMPLGDGMGDLWDVVHPVRKDLKIKQPGTCKVEISSTMSQADLPGILQVGLLVMKNE
jgi:gliding motility-associated lipoprotein GldH